MFPSMHRCLGGTGAPRTLDRTEYVCLVGGAGWGGEGTASQEVTDRVAHGAPALATTGGASMMRQALAKAGPLCGEVGGRRPHNEVYVEA